MAIHLYKSIITDDSLENVSKVFGKNMSVVYKKVYSGDFKRFILLVDYI